MHSWKKAFWLATFKLTASVKESFLLLLTYIVIFVVIVSSLSTYFKNGSFIFDVFFIAVFAGLAPSWIKRLANNSRTTLFLQLPIKLSTIIKGKIISYLIYTIPFLFILLVSLYTASNELQTMMSPFMYLCFSIVLLSFAAISFDHIPIDRTTQANVKITTKRILMLSLAGLLFVGTFVFIQFFSNYGIIHSLILIIQKQTLLLACLSVIFASLVIRYRYIKMHRMIQTVDYF